MKKFTYYFTNNKGEKQIARKQTDNNYGFGLIITNKETKEQQCIKCSGQMKIIQQEINYQKKYYSKEYLEKFELSIVELIQVANR